MRRCILVVAQDVALRAELARLLMSAGHWVEIAEGEKRAREVLAGGDVGIAMLAPEEFGAGGRPLMRLLDEAGVMTMLLSGRPEETGRRVGPPLNSAIRLSLPLDSGLVLAQVAAVLDAVTSAASPPTLAPAITHFDGLTLDIEGRSAFDAAGREVPLTRLEFILLAVFAQQPGRVLSRDQLLEAVSGRKADRYDRSIDVLVTRLRRKIEPDRKKPRLIVTVAGVGYKFAAKPRTIDLRTTASSADDGLVPLRSRTPERRQLTVICCGITELATLSTRLDPEDLQAAVTGYRRSCEQVAANFGGSLASVLHDGAVFHFGYPQAHEDDAERAVRAGLVLLERLAPLGRDSRKSFRARIGIATGLVLVQTGEAATAAGEIVAIGEAPNLAARLRFAAAPGSVVVDANTRRLIGNLFKYRDVSVAATDGFPDPILAWQVTGQSPAGSRFEALRGLSLSPLVGREEEIELLLRRWNRTVAGDGQVVLISGEPGIGKSRIAAALRERLPQQSYLRQDYFCSAHHCDSPLYPIIRQLEHAASFAQDDQVEIKLNKLSDLLGSAASAIDLPLLRELLSLPATGQSVRIQDLAPQRRREKTLEALVQPIDSRARRQAMVITFEDVQWIDATSRELLDLVIERIRRLPVLLLVTFREEFQPTWIGQSHVTMLALNRLNRRDAAMLVRRIAAGLPGEVVAEIVERTDGVPLFIEELTKAVLEAGNQEDGIACVISASPSSRAAVPATLHSSLMARLDRLGPMAKEVAQIGALLGREFSYELLRSVCGCHEAELRLVLDRLSGAGIVWCRGTAPHSFYVFKHALLQEAAYGALLRGSRQLLHSRPADALISTVGESATPAPEIIGHHLQSAGRSHEAIAYWRQAGQQAVRRAANREAVGHLRGALSLLEMQPETPECSRAELAILLQLGPALMSLHGWSASEVGETIERAGDVARGLRSSADLAPSIANLWSFNVARGRYDRAEENSRDLFRIAREVDDPDIMLQAHHTAQGNLALRGQFAAAAEHINAALSLYDAERHSRHRYLYLGHDPGVCMLALSAVMQSALGYPRAAMRREREALVAARKLEHAPSLAQALWFVCESQSARGDAGAVHDTATELLELSEEYGLLQPRSFALIFRGWALALCGKSSEGIASLAEGLGAFSRMGGRMHLTRSLCLMAESLLASERYSEGLEYVTRALDIATEIREQWYLSRLHLVRAELLRAGSPGGKRGEASLRRALAVARGQGARGWELRASVSLARVWFDRGQQSDAAELLASLCARLAQGLDGPNLDDATVLLGAISSAGAAAGCVAVRIRPSK
jgi:DNA-binding response OmpR family regulator/class 3 adenylate cyclase/predicted ATPase